jgi:hypothetical protein
MELGQEAIETTIRNMPRTYTSEDFTTVFGNNHPALYDSFVQIYLDRPDQPHAIQIVHSQLMDTVNDRFLRLTRKVRTIPNPEGGDMSEWVLL